MSRKARLPIGFMVGVALAGCANPHVKLPPDSQRVLKVEAALEREFSKSGNVCFLSYNGERIGTDNDVHLELFANGDVVVTVYGFAILKSEGNYSVNDNAEIILSLKDEIAYDFGPLRLYFDGSDLVIYPADFHSGSNENWPYRQVKCESVAD